MKQINQVFLNMHTFHLYTLFTVIIYVESEAISVSTKQTARQQWQQNDESSLVILIHMGNLTYSNGTM